MYGLFGVSAVGRCFPQCRRFPHLYNVSTGSHGVGSCNGVLMVVLIGIGVQQAETGTVTKERLTDEDMADMILWLL